MLEPNWYIFQKCVFCSSDSLRSEPSVASAVRLILSICVSESEDEVEEIEEQVPSPDVATEESAAFYNPVSW